MSTTSNSAMHQWLDRGMRSRSGLMRKGCMFVLQTAKRLTRRGAEWAEYAAHPPVLANSFPKSGTHLLDQIVAGLPGRTNYGGFLSSMTSSFQMRERSDPSVIRYIRATAPAENMRAHLFYKPMYAAELERLNFVHYFIYRDPRDVIVSSCHYLREINPWHRLRRHFKACKTMEDAILLSIRGLKDKDPSIPLSNIADRFASYAGWIDNPTACAVRFEDLRGQQRTATLERLIAYYAQHCAESPPLDATLRLVESSIQPEKSHTFRKGKGGGWVEEFTPACKDAFKEVTGDLLVRLGYETNNDW